jgi:eukaryotic-like serine/threonine-protein kinase
MSASVPRNLFGYDVLEPLGQGARSAIYAVSCPQTRQLYAAKYVVRENEKDTRFFEQLENEFEITRQFKHPGLRRSINLKTNKTLFRKTQEALLVMELFDGTQLDAALPPGVAATVKQFADVASALAALHELGYVHCDLKPNNILVGHDGQIKIIDFGQTCPVGTKKERIQGTPDYIAPEQVKREPVSFCTDVFNFGATMYWALSGKKLPTLITLSKGENSFLLDDMIPAPAQVNPQVPHNVSELVMECVRTNPLKRPDDMAELSRRLEAMAIGIDRRTRGIVMPQSMVLPDPDDSYLSVA